MKRLLQKFLILLLCIVVAGHTYAIKVITDGFVFDVIKKGRIAKLINGEKFCHNDLVIPEYITHEGVDCAVTSIGDWAFCYGKFSTVTIPSSVTSIGYEAFMSCRELTSIIIPNSVTSIRDKAFYGCSKLESISMPNTITSIGCSAFAWCKSLTDIVLPNGVSTIAKETFNNCFSLRSVVIPSGVTHIGNDAFYHCNSLTTIEIPEGTTGIGSGAFSFCQNLTSIKLPKSITDIHDAFQNCDNLEDVYCYATKVPYTFEHCFYGSYIEYATLHVPASAINAYKTSKPWSDFKNIVSISEDNR